MNPLSWLKNRRKHFIPLSQAANFAPYSQDYLNLRARQGKLKATKIGRDWFTTREWVERYVRETEKAKLTRTKNFQASRAVISWPSPFWGDGIPRLVSLVSRFVGFAPRRKILVGLGVFLFVVLSVFVFASVQARPQKVNLYFSDCEGGWESPAYIQGNPDVGENGEGEEFTSANSARYASGALTVDCGGLDDVPGGRVKSRRLGLSFATLSELPVVERIPGVEEPAAPPVLPEEEEEEEIVSPEPEKVETKKINRVAPRASARVNKEDADPNEALTFDASGSQDADSDTLFYTWNFGDGAHAKEKITTHSYSEPGVYNVVLLVSDGELDAYGFLTITVRGEEEETSPSSFLFNHSVYASSHEENVTSTPPSLEASEGQAESLPTSTDEVIIDEGESSSELPTSTPSTSSGQAEPLIPIEEEEEIVEEAPAATEETITETVPPAGEEEEEVVEEVPTEEVPTEEVPTQEGLTLPEHLLRISVSLDKGETWDVVGAIDQIPFSNKDAGGYLMFDLPHTLFSYDRRLQDIQVRIEGLLEEGTPVEIFIDSVWVEATLTDPREALLEIEREEFAQNEKPHFRVRVEDPQTLLDFFQGLNPFIPPKDKIDVSLAWSLLDPRGRKVGEVPIEFTPLIAATEDEAEWEIIVSPLNTFRPGRYTFSIQAVDEEWNVLEVEKEFNWGLLAINTGKSVYLPADDVDLDFVVIDERGVRICDAYLSLLITEPDGSQEELTTDGGSIKSNPLCAIGEPSGDSPPQWGLSPSDYRATWRAGNKPGGYQFDLVASFTNSDGREETHGIKDILVVAKDEDVPFDITRSGPTRVIPGETYEMRMQITARRRSYSGPLIEHLPPGFLVSDTGWRKIVTESDVGLPFAEVAPYEASFVQWNVEFEAGGVYELGYTFEAPDDVPQFWLLGPLAFFRDSGGFVPAESLNLRERLFRAEAKEALNAFSKNSGTSFLGSEDPKVPSIINEQDLLFAESRFWQISSAFLEKPIKQKVLLKVKDLSILGIGVFEKTDFRLDEEPNFAFLADPVLDVEALVERGEAEILQDEDRGTTQNQTQNNAESEEETQELLEETIETIRERIIEPIIEPGGGEEPVSRLNLETLVEWLFGAEEVQARRHQNITAEIFGPGGSRAAIQPVIEQGDTEFNVAIPKPGRSFEPGRYTLRLEWETEDAIIFAEQDFTWGVLAINTNKSIYTRNDANEKANLHERAYIQMGVLDDRGHTICNAQMELKVKSPKSKVTTLSTDDGTIQYSDECLGDTVTSKPDYFAYYDIPDEAGSYTITLTATTPNGTRSMKDSFEARAETPFDVERIGPTRIYPVASYEMVMRIRANEDFKGQIIEQVPASFEIVSVVPRDVPRGSAEITTEGDTKLITWQVSWEEGNTYELSYTFDAPEKSPEFYLLGPLEFRISPGLINRIFGPADQVVFREIRNWQIAVDALAAAGATCTAQSKADDTSLTCTVGTENIEAGNIAILWFAGNNTATVDGNDGLLSSVTDSAGNTWTVQRCFTNAQGGAATGATTCIAWSKLSTALVSGSGTITANYASIAAKAIVTKEFTVGAGNTIEVAGTPVDAVGDGVVPPSMTISGLASAQYLFVRATALERPTGGTWTVSTGYTSSGCNGTTRGGGASNMDICGEFRILTGTGDTSNPTGTAVDNANMYIAFREVAVVVNISGTCDQFNQTTDCVDAAGKQVRVAVGATLQTQVDTVVDGAWSITGVIQPAAGAIVTVFVGDEGAGTVPDAEKAVAVLEYDGTGNIDGVTLFERHLTIGTTAGLNADATITNTELSSFDDSVDTNDDVFHDVNITDDLTVSVIAAHTDEELYIVTGDTFQPASAGGADVSTHDIEIVGTFTMNSNVVNVNGSWVTSGTFSGAAGQTVTFNSTATGETITTGASNFQNVTFNGSGGGWSFSAADTINGDLTMTAGTLVGANNITVNGGDVTGNGTINLTGGTFTINTVGNLGGATAWTFSGLTIGAAGNATTTATGAGGMTVTGVLTIDIGDTLDAGSKTWTLSGTGPVFTNSGTFTYGTSTVNYTGTSAGVGVLGLNGTGGTNGYYNLGVGTAADANTVTYELSAATTANNALTIGASSGVGIHRLSTSGTNYALGAATITINSSGDLTANDSTITISDTGNVFTNSGTFTYGTSTVNYTGTSATTTVLGMSGTGGTDGYYNLGVGTTADATEVTYALSASTTVNNALTVGASTDIGIHALNTDAVNSYTLTAGTITINSLGALVANGSTINITNPLVTGSATISTNFDGNYSLFGNSCTDIFTLTVSYISSDNEWATYIKFPLNSIPANATITSVELDVYVNDVGFSSTLLADVQAYNQDGQADPQTDACATRYTRVANDASPYLNDIIDLRTTGFKYWTLPAAAQTDVANAKAAVNIFSIGINKNSSVADTPNQAVMDSIESAGSNEAKLIVGYTAISQTPFINSGIFYYGNSTVNYTGTSTATTVLGMSGTGGANGYYNLGVGTTADATSVTYTLGGATVANNALTIGASSGAGVHTLSTDGTNNYALTASTITINSSGALTANGSTITVSGNWTNSGILNEGTSTITLDGLTSTTFNSGCADVTTCTTTNFYNLTINKTGAADANDNVTLSTNGVRLTNTLTITDGELIQGALNVRVEGSAAVSVAAAGKWNNVSTGDLTLGGTFTNAGAVIFNSSGGSCGDAKDILIRSTVGATQRNWAGAGTFDMQDLDVQDMTSTPTITVTNFTFTNVGANWVGAGCGITVSGVIRQTNESTAFDCSVTNLTVRVRVNGAGTYSGTCTLATGAYSVTGVTIGAASDVVTAWVDNGGVSYSGSVVTLTVNTTSNITDLDFYQNRVIVRHENAGPITNTNLGQCDDNSPAACTDTDIGFTSDAGVLTVNAAREFHVWTGKTFTPGGTVTTTAGGANGDVHIDTGATLAMAANALSIGGSLTTVTTGTVTSSAGQTTTFAATATGKTLTLGSALTLQNLTFNGTGGGWSVATSALTVAGNLIMTAGTLSGSTQNITVNGNVACGATCGTINLTGATFEQRTAAAANFGTNVAVATAWTFNNLTFSASTASTITFSSVGTGAINVTGVLTVGGAAAPTSTVNFGNRTVVLSGSGTPFSITANGSFLAGSSLIRYTSTAATNITAATYNNLELIPAATVTYTLGTGASQTITTNGYLTVGNGTNAVTVTAATNNPVLDVLGNFTIAAAGIFTASSTGTFKVAGDWTNSGTLNEGTGTVELYGTTSTNLNSGCANETTCTAQNFANLTINKTAAGDADDNVTLLTNPLRVTTTITITDGELIQGTLNVRAEGTTTSVSIAAAGKWTNISTGDLAIDGDFSNAGTATFQGNGATCGDADSIVISMVAGPTKPDWTGAGTYTMQDVDISNQNAGVAITIKSGTNGAGNTGLWTFDPCVKVSGTTNLGDGLTVRVALDTTLQADTTTTLTGAWTVNITGAPPASGARITVWIDAVADTSESTGVTKYDGTGDITGMVLNSNVLTVGSTDNQSLTVTDLGQYDCEQDEDIMHTANTGVLDVEEASAICAGAVANSYTDEGIRVLASNTLTIGGTETLDAHNVIIDGSLTSGGAGTFTVSGSWDNNNDFNTSTETVTFTLEGTETLNSTGAVDADFNAVTLNGSGSLSVDGAALLINTDLTMTAGTFQGAQSVTVNGGDVTGDGTINMTGGTLLVDAAGNFGGATAWTFANLTFGDGVGAATTTTTGAGGITVSADLTIALNQTLDAKGKTWTLSGTDGSPFTISGTLDDTTNTSIFSFTGNNGAGDTTVPASTGYHSITLNNASEQWVLGGTVTMSGDLTVTAGTLSEGVDSLTVNGGDITGDGTITFTGSTTVTLDGAGNFGGATAWTFANLTFGDGVGAATTTTTGAGGVTVSSVLTIAANHTLDAKGKTWTLSGTTGAPFVINGTLNDSTDTSTFTFTGDNGAGNTTVPASTAYHSITLNNGTETFVLGGAVTMSGDLTVTAGTLAEGVDSLTVNGGDITGDGTITFTGSTTVTLDGAGNFGGATAWTFANLTFGDGVGAATTTTTGAGGVTVSSVLTIAASQTLDAGAKTYTLSGAGTPFVVTGTFTASTSTFVFNADAAVTVAATTYNNLTFSPTITLARTYTMAGATAINGTWSINPDAASALALTVNLGGAITGSPAISITRTGANATSILNTTATNYAITAGSITIAAGGTLTANGSTITLTGSGAPFTVTGTFTYNTSTVNYTGTAAGVTVLGMTGTGGTNGYYNLGVGTTADATNVTYTLSASTTVNNALTVGASSGAGIHTLSTDGTNNYALTASTITINSSGALTANGSLVTITGTGTPFTDSGTFTYGTSTIRYTGNGATIRALSGTGGTNGYWNLEAKPGSISAQTLAEGASLTIAINNNFIVGDGTNAGATAATNNPALDIGGNVTISANATLTASSSASFTVGGSWSNSGAFGANSGTVTFDAAQTGKTVTTGGSNWYVLAFVNSLGGWTLNDSLTITSAFNITSGTLTWGDGNGDNLTTSNGATTTISSGATLQSKQDLPQGSTMTWTAGGTISVSGTLDIGKNVTINLNSALSVEDGIEVEATGYLEIGGTQDDTDDDTGIAGIDSVTHDAGTTITLTDANQNWTVNGHQNKHVRITNASSLAFGKIYTISSNTATTLTFTDDYDTEDSAASVSGSGPIYTISAAGLISANQEAIGQYIYNKTDNKYYKIVYSTSPSIFEVISEPDTVPASLGTVKRADGIRINDEFEIIDYAVITAESTNHGYIWAKAGSETLIQYADISELGKGSANKYGVSFYSVDSANAGESAKVSKSRIYNGYVGIYLNGSSNNNATYSAGFTDNTMYGNSWIAIWLVSSSNNAISSNRSNGDKGGIFLSSSSNNTVSSNIVCGSTATTNGSIYLISSSNNTVSSNIACGGTYWQSLGLVINQSSRNTVYSNDVYGNNWYNIYFISSSNNMVFSNSSYRVAGTGFYSSDSPNNVLFNNAFYSNALGVYLISSSNDNVFFSNGIYSNYQDAGLYVLGSTGTVSINDDYGVSGGNIKDIWSGDNIDLRFYNVDLASSNEVQVGVTGAYLISKKHDSTQGLTKIWGKYTVPDDNLETPQDEGTQKFNFAENLWKDSITDPGYSGTGTKDADIDLAFNGGSLGGSPPYAYRIANTVANTTFDVVRYDSSGNKVDAGDATVGSQFTDSITNVRFTIQDAGIDYAVGDTYTFVAWKNSSDTNTQKTLAIQQADDKITVGSGETLELKGGGSASGDISQITHTITGTWDFNVSGGTVSVEEATINDMDLIGGTLTVLNTTLNGESAPAVGATLNADWYLGAHLVDAATGLINIGSGPSDITISENSATPASTVFRHNGSVWGSGGISQTTGSSGVNGLIPQPGSDGAIRIREYARTSAGFTYYKYNIKVAWQTNYGKYDYWDDYGENYITSVLNIGSGEDEVISEANWRRNDIDANNVEPAVNAPPTNGTWYVGMITGLSFSLDSSTVTFAELNTANNFTATATTTTTVSTSATSGYVITAWSTQVMTNTQDASYTIADWSGTNASPTAWTGNCPVNSECGFGYSTNDTNLSGGTASRFSGGLYAGFTHVGPGKEVADETAPVVNSQFTITYKIGADLTKPAGTYNTVVIYVATAQY